MKQITRALLLAILALGSLGELYAQDPNYSQFYANPLYYNPAYTGISQGFRARFDYRKQWPNLPNDFKTYNFNTDISVRDFPGSGGLGLIFNKDKAGNGYLESTMAGILTAVRIRLAQNVMTQVGVMSSFIQKQVDWQKLVFTDQLHPVFGITNPSEFIAPANDRVAYPDFNAGTVIRFAQSTGANTNIVGTMGVAMHHLFEPNESFFEESAKLPRKLVVHADLIIEKEGYGQSRNQRGKSSYNSQKFNPGLYYMKQGPFQTYGFGINMYYSNLYGGLWYRNQDFDFVNSDAVVLMLGINTQFNESSRIKIMYSYDLALNSYLNQTGGAHEISILIELDDFSLFSVGQKNYGPGVKTSRGTVYSPLECSPF